MPFAFGRRFFRLNWGSDFLNFDILVMSSPITFLLTSMTIYAQAPGFFFMDRTSPTTTLP